MRQARTGFNSFHIRRRGWLVAACMLVLGSGIAVSVADEWNPNSAGGSTTGNVFSNQLSSDGLRVGGIANTRHNLTMSYLAAGGNGETRMNNVRNNYYEICVYCHTPHGANSTAAAPLWNRTVTPRQYTLYNSNKLNPTMTGQPISQPGPNSLTCLSCHDGVTAIDSIINMPTQLEGSFRAGYLTRSDDATYGEISFQETGTSATFLDAWGTSGNQLLADNGGPVATVDKLGGVQNHVGLASGAAACMTCHNVNDTNIPTPPDFSAFIIGGQLIKRTEIKDPVTGDITYSYSSGEEGSGPAGVSSVLTSAGGKALFDDHPIGVRYPSEFGPGVDYNEPNVVKPRIAFFDNNGNDHADANEVRLYNTGDGYEVECASCHDPHGVPVNYDRNGAAESGSGMIPSFLRVGSYSSASTSSAQPVDSPTRRLGNTGSQLCLTCHVK